MPEMDGFEVCKRLKQASPTKDIPIIFITAKDDKKSQIKGYDLGALDYLIKPFDKHELVYKIRNYLKLSQLEIELKQELHERKKVEEKLSASESQYRSIVENQTSFVVRHLPDGTCTFINNSYSKYLNKSPGELIGTNMFSFLPKKEKKTIKSVIQRLSPEEPTQSGEYKISLPDGRVIWQSWVHKGLFDPRGRMKEIQAVGRDISEFKSTEEAVRIISEETAGLSGQLFFNTLVKSICELLNVEFAFIGEYKKEKPNTIGTSVLCHRNEIIDNFEYDLTDTPCQNVFGKELCIYPEGVQDLFPKDSLLADMGVESYAGTPLFGKDKIPLGLLVVLHTGPLKNPDFTKTLLKAFSVRAAAELERKRQDQDLRQSENMFRMAFTHAAIGKVMADSDGRFIWVNDAMTQIIGFQEEE